jgi:beta-xylosidase/AraC-like DNA-binding protein
METVNGWFYETGTRVYRLTRPIQHPVPGIEALFVLEGGVQVEAGSVSRALSETDILLLSRRERVRIIPAAGQGKDNLLFTLRIAPRLLSFAFGDVIPDFDCDSTVGTHDFSALRGILAEIACNDPPNSSVEDNLPFYSLLFRLFYELKQHFLAAAEETQPAVLSGESGEAKREKAIAAYIRKNFRYPISLEEAADHFSLTPQYLSRYFKKRFGVNFHGYINDLRLESAKKDLVLGGETVTTIAYNNGFPNLNSFLKALLDATGLTPTAFRKTHRAKEQEDEYAGCDDDSIEPVLVREKLKPYIKTEIRSSPMNERLVIEADILNGSAYEKPWEEVINLGFARDFLKTAFFDQINLLQKESPFRYGRFQGLFGESASIVKRPRQEYHFVQTDRIINFLYEVNLIPFVELSLKPDTIQGRHGERHIVSYREGIPDIPLDEYEDLLDKFLKHIVNRYGPEEIGRWRFEMMAPYGEMLEFTKSGIDAYIEMFARIRRIIKAIAPSALVGGPGFNIAIPEKQEVMGKLLHDLEERGASPDFFSIYAFSFSPMPAAEKNLKNALLWEKRESALRTAWSKKFIQSINPSIKKFFVSEWNLDFSSRNRLHDFLIKAPFILQNCVDAAGTVDVLCYWLASDITAEYSDSSAILFGGPGLISRHGIRKPSFFAYHFLSRLGPVLLAKGEGYIVTAKNENNYAAIVFNYKYISNQSRLRNDYHDLAKDPAEFLENQNNLTVSLHIANTRPGRYKLCSHILNTRSGSVYDAWKRLSAVEELSDAEVSWLERTCVPALQIDFLDRKECLTMECELEPNEVRLLEISFILE